MADIVRRLMTGTATGPETFELYEEAAKEIVRLRFMVELLERERDEARAASKVRA